MNDESHGTEISEMLSKALKPFLFKKVTPNMAQQMVKLLTPTLIEIAERQHPNPEELFETSMDGTTLSIKPKLDAWEGATAERFRLMGFAVPQNVPDLATLHGGKWDWIEVEFIVEDKHESQ